MVVGVARALLAANIGQLWRGEGRFVGFVAIAAAAAAWAHRDVVPG